MTTEVIKFFFEVLLKDQDIVAKYGDIISNLDIKDPRLARYCVIDNGSTKEAGAAVPRPIVEPIIVSSGKTTALAETVIPNTMVDAQLHSTIVSNPIVSQTMEITQASAPASNVDAECMDTSSSRSASPVPEDAQPSEPSDSSSSDEDFTVVQGGKRKKNKNNDKARKTIALAASPLPSPPAVSTASPAPSPSTSQVASSQGAAKPKSAPKNKPPPPVYLQDKAKWTEVSKLCVDRKINYRSASNTGNGIKIVLPTSDDYREITKALRARNISFHTYSLPEEKPLRVVITRIPKEIPSDDILSDLKSQNIPATQVHRMHRARSGHAFDMVLVVCEPCPSKIHPIFNIKSVCNLTGISIEKPNRSGIVSQCHRCQLWGHSQRNCFAQPRCVKCLGQHGTSDCPRPKDRTLCTEPPSCVLCGASGHPANYRGCPKAPKTSPKLAKRANARQLRESPSARLPTAQLPERLSPQRPSPWNPLNHQRAFPTPRPTQPQPTPAPVNNSTAAPASLPRVPPVLPSAPSAPSAAPIAAKPAQAQAIAPSSSPVSALSSMNVILSTFSVFTSDRAQQLSREIVASNGDLIKLYSVMQEYSDVAQAVQNLPHFRK